MPATTPPSPGAKVDAIVVDPLACCATCPHAWGAHDPISVRYCTATAAAGQRRGCVCESATSTAYGRR